MKKALQLFIACALAVGANAQQNTLTTSSAPGKVEVGGSDQIILLESRAQSKGTGVTDTFHYGTTKQKVGPYVNVWTDFALPLDSGYIHGPNARGYKGFAQYYGLRLDQSGDGDSSVEITHVIGRFAGRIQPNSTKKITISVWDRGTNKIAVPNRAKLYVYGTPTTTLATKDIDAKNLTVNARNIIPLTAPLTGINKSVYVGYSITYNWSAMAQDTFGLSAVDGVSFGSVSVETGTNDTLISADNLIQESAGTWKSPSWNLNVSGTGAAAIYPVLRFKCNSCWPSAIGGVGNNDLTFFGNYPNPAINNTTIKFSLKENADVTVEVIDAAGRTISQISKSGMSAGVNTINVETANLPAGNYIYMIQSSKGGTIASQFTVAK